MVAEILGKKYELRFGYGVLKDICQAYGHDKVSGFDSIVKELKLDKMTDPSFDQMDFFGRLVISGIKNVDKKTDLTSDDVLDAIFTGGLNILEIFEAFKDSLPKQPEASLGKQKRGRK